MSSKKKINEEIIKQKNEFQTKKLNPLVFKFLTPLYWITIRERDEKTVLSVSSSQNKEIDEHNNIGGKKAT